MLKRIEKGEGNGIFAWNASRISRNSVDTGEVIYLMDQKKLLVVRTSSQIFRNTPNDKFLLALFCNQAKLENDNKGVDVRRGLMTKAGLGHLPSGAKPGYMNDPYAEKGSKVIKEDPVRFPIIKEAWRLMLMGIYNPPRVLEIITGLGYLTPRKKKIGGKPMSRSQIYTMFRDPFYHGQFEFPKGSGNWFNGSHKPMITEDEFWKVQEFLGRRGRPHPSKHTFTFTGMMHCRVCEGGITADNRYKKQKNGTVHHYIHYHCTRRKRNIKCTQGVVQEGELMAQIIQKLDELEIPEEFHEFGMRWMEEENKKEANNTGNIHGKLEKDYADCLITIDGLIDMRARGELNENDYKRRRNDAEKEKARLRVLLNNLDGQDDGWVETANDAFHFVEFAKEKFKNGSPEKSDTFNLRFEPHTKGQNTQH